MPLHRLLENSGFTPEHTSAMATAFDAVCRDFQIAPHEQARRELVAQHVIEFAARGERDAAKLRAHVLAAMR
jgi:hypothetical protein